VIPGTFVKKFFFEFDEQLYSRTSVRSVFFLGLFLMNVFVREEKMPATYSTEGKLETGLRELQCSGRNFIKVAKVFGISISDGKFSEALNGKGRLDTAVGEKLLGLLQEMRDLRTTVGAPIDWSQSDEVSGQLAQCRAIKEAVKYDEDVVRKFLDDVTDAK